MEFEQKHTLIQVLSLSIIFFVLIIFLSAAKKPQKVYPAKGSTLTTILTPTPTVFNPFPYKIPIIPNTRSYRIMLVGDSIVDSLGPNADVLRRHLIELYPAHEFVNYNYGYGATSIETLPDRLNKETTYLGKQNPSILSQGFDLIIIESFAYNPLSQSEQGEGIAKHIKILDESIKQIIKSKPEAVIAIMTPIAPNRYYFAKGVYDLSTEERGKWVDERVAYINAVIEYAEKNKVPLINVYEKSLTGDGNGDLRYINPNDFIHPSAQGVELISTTITEYIYQYKIFPQ